MSDKSSVTRRGSTFVSSKQQIEVSGIELSDNKFAMKHLKQFCELDRNKDGTIDASEIKTLLANVGVKFSSKDVAKYMQELDASGDGSITFDEFLRCAKRITSLQTKGKGKLSRIPRFYLDSFHFQKFEALFYEAAGQDGHVSISELQDFFTSKNVTIPKERLDSIVQEVDEDKSGELELDEFLILLIKAQGMKKRKVGPDHCAAAKLREEGWVLGELKKVGYSVAALREAGYSILELMDVCSAKEFHDERIPLKELLDAGWDCTHAKDAGFELKDLALGGAIVRNIRNAGFTDTASLVSLRKFGFETSKLKQGGFSLSDLRTAGYSTSQLRLAGFSNLADRKSVV